MSPEELAAIEKYLANLRGGTVRFGKEAFDRNDPDEAHRHADRLRELNKADDALIALKEAIKNLHDSLGAFPPLPAAHTPAVPPVLQPRPVAPPSAPSSSPPVPPRGTVTGAGRNPPVATQLAGGLENEILSLPDGPRIALGKLHGKALTVLSGSHARRLESQWITPDAVEMRANLLKNGALVPKDHETLVFTRDVEFSSVSAAAKTILARSANGRQVWRRANGRTRTRAPKGF